MESNRKDVVFALRRVSGYACAADVLIAETEEGSGIAVLGADPISSGAELSVLTGVFSDMLRETTLANDGRR